MRDIATPSSVSIKAELLKLAYKPSPFIPIIVIVISLVLCYFAIDSAPAIIWQSWLAFLIIATIVRYYSLKFVLARKTLSAEQKLNFTHYVSICTGIVHALSLCLFPYFTPLEAAIQTTFFITLTGSIVFYTFGYRASFLTYSPIMLIPMAAAWFFIPIEGMMADAQYVIGGLVLISLWGLYLSSKIYYKLFEDTYYARHEKDELNHRLTDALEEAVRAGQSKTRFLASASHDLRQPIHTLSLLSAAMSTCTLDEKSSKIAGHMDTAIVNLGAQMDGLLDISKLDAGLVENTPKPINLTSFLNRIVAEHVPMCAEKNIKLIDNITDQKFYTELDIELFERVIRNLLTNAIKYTDQGSITIDLKRNDDALIISISDTGKGIAEKNQRRIFEEFVQIENQHRDHSQGLGLGLAIVKRLTLLMDIEVTLDSSIGLGTTINLELRAFDGDRPQTIPKPTPSLNAKGRRILCIDDEQNILDALGILLSAMDFEIDLAATQEQAIAMAKENRPDLILSDFSLGDNINGIEVIAKLHKLYVDVPALLVTGDTHPDRLIEANNAGLEIIHKPVDADTLKEKLSELISIDT